MGVGDILRKYGTIGKYLHEQCKGNLVHIMENYVRSCAGYCVITYILGVGDRHNDNLLITNEGKLFHIDFGFILGRDPKPLPPPLKLNREMVEAMGSDGWSQFKSYCYEAYINLRRHSQLILSLFGNRDTLHFLTSSRPRIITKLLQGLQEPWTPLQNIERISNKFGVAGHFVTDFCPDKMNESLHE